jgi:hypothetical protein
MLDTDNYSYYLCNGIAFSSKINACIYSTEFKKPIEWVFHQDKFSKYPWEIEPSETLDQLYDRRTRQLREKYDYIVLSYSGGADTNNILESFIRQGLHIDEIVTNHISKATKRTTVLDPQFKDSWNFAAEHELQAIPRLKYIRDKLPRTKITVLDVSDIVMNSISSLTDPDWVLNRNDHLAVGQLFRYNYFHFNDMKKQFDKDLKVAIIVGVDKPKTQIINGDDFVIFFNDATANITTVNDFNQDYTNVTTEMFYWSPDAADILCKQAHVIRRWLEMNPDKQRFWTNISKYIRRRYHERWLRTLLYTTWDDTWFQADKSTDWWHTEFDTWFRRDQNFAKEQRAWKQGIEYLKKTIPDYIVYNAYGIPDALKDFKHEYYIGKIKNGIIQI